MEVNDSQQLGIRSEQILKPTLAEIMRIRQMFEAARDKYEESAQGWREHARELRLAHLSLTQAQRHLKDLEALALTIPEAQEGSNAEQRAASLRRYLANNADYVGAQAAIDLNASNVAMLQDELQSWRDDMSLAKREMDFAIALLVRED